MDRRTPNAERKHRLNREIMAPQVRLNGPENEPLGIVQLMEALRMAGELTWTWWRSLPPPTPRSAG
jgi:translation initiation factor IF-3